MASISFKDVEEALERFQGHNYENIDQWVEQFEDAATTCKWSDAQKYIFARRLMRDEAKGFVMSPINKTKIKDYATLVANLKIEFKDEASQIEIHERLIRRKKERDESLLSYMYTIIKMANGKFDDKSIVRCVVGGLPEDGRNKTMLLEAATVDELKKKLKVYELSAPSQPVTGGTQQTGTGQKGPAKKQTDKNPQKGGVKKAKCFICNSEEHKKDACPDKAKGRKCYNCQSFGHIAKDCMAAKKPETKPKEVYCVDNERQRMRFPAAINDRKTTAVLDTSSDFTLMRRTLYKKSGMGRLDDSAV